MTQTPAAGWYADPLRPGDTVRYWNGTAWTQHVQPMPTSADFAGPQSQDLSPSSRLGEESKFWPVNATQEAAPLTQARASMFTANSRESVSSGNRTGWWVAGGAAALALVFGLGWLVSVNGGGRQTPNAGPIPSTRAETIKVEFSLEKGGSCTYGEIQQGDTVIVKSGAGAIIGKGELSGEEIYRKNVSPSMGCLLTSTFTVPKDSQGIYQVGVENSEGSLTYDQGDVVNGVLTVQTSFG